MTNTKPMLLVAILAFALTASAGTITYSTILNGANEVPSNAATGTGSIVVTVNTVANTLMVTEFWNGLTGVPTGAHIHCCGIVGTNQPVAVPFTAFPSGTAGTYNNTFDLTLAATYTSAFITASGGTAATAEAALFAGLAGGQAYANIHTANFPGGEIRGQLALTPEPASAAMILFGVASLLVAGRKRLR